MFQQMLGVCGTTLVSPGWLGLGITLLKDLPPKQELSQGLYAPDCEEGMWLRKQ